MGQRFNPVSLPMARAGMELLHGWGQQALAARLRATTDRLAEHASACGLEPVPPQFRAPHILGLEIPDGGAARLVEELAARQVYVAERGGRIRIGAHIFNDEEDTARFGAALASAAGRGA
jgi:selenocysteine lyase/cysteine desulfurase